MTQKNQGFTIIEISLFVAISAVMLIIGFTAVSGRTEEVQFMDSTRTLESQLRRHMSNVGTGLNLRGDYDCSASGSSIDLTSDPSSPNPGQDRDCVANGTFLAFSQDDEYVIQAVASSAEIDQDSSSLENAKDKLSNRATKPIPDTDQSIGYNWETKYTGGFVDDKGSVTPVSELAFLRLRSINSSQEYTFVKTSASNDLSGFSEIIAEGHEYGVCIEDESGRSAALVIGEGGQFRAVLADDDDRCS